MKLNNIITLSSSRFWNGLYLFKLGLYILGYINFSVVLNLLTFLGLCIRFKNNIVQKIYGFLIGLFALMLFYHDSFLPSIEQMLAQKANLTGFSVSYMIEFAYSFINFTMVFAFIAAIAVLSFVTKYIRIQNLIIILIVGINFINVARIRDGLRSDPDMRITAISNEQGDLVAKLTQSGMDKYFSQFHEDESERKVLMPDTANAPVDIILIHADGMTNSDMQSFSFNENNVFSRFNIFLTKFNSVSTDANINTKRLLNSMCGQKDIDSYKTPEKECNLITALNEKKYLTRGFFDNQKIYLENKDSFSDSYVNSEKTKEANDRITALFENCLKQLKNQDIKQSSISYISIDSLSDTSDFLKYKSNATRFMLSLNSFIDQLQRSNRNILLIYVPSKGALERKRFDIIPSRKQLEGTAMIKFIDGTKSYESVVFDKSTSYIAISDLTVKTLKGEFLDKRQYFSVKAFIEDTAVTPFVGEDFNCNYIELFKKQYFKLHNANWTELKDN